MVCVKSGSLCLLHYQAQIVNTANAWQLLKTVGWQMKKSEENERIHLKLMQSTLSCHGCKGRVSGICTHTNRSKSHHIKLPLDSFLSSSAQWERDTHRERRETRRESERETDRDRQRWETDRQKERDGRQRERWETERERWHGERERHADRQTNWQTDTDRQMDKQTDGERTYDFGLLGFNITSTRDARHSHCCFLCLFLFSITVLWRWKQNIHLSFSTVPCTVCWLTLLNPQQIVHWFSNVFSY